VLSRVTRKTHPINIDELVSDPQPGRLQHITLITAPLDSLLRLCVCKCPMDPRQDTPWTKHTERSTKHTQARDDTYLQMWKLQYFSTAIVVSHAV